MFLSLLNIFVAVAMGSVVLAQQLGWLLPGDAFFAAVAILAIYTAYHLSARDGMPISRALKGMFLEPRTHGGQTAYWSYLISAGLAVLVITQSVLAA